MNGALHYGRERRVRSFTDVVNRQENDVHACKLSEEGLPITTTFLPEACSIWNLPTLRRFLREIYPAPRSISGARWWQSTGRVSPW